MTVHSLERTPADDGTPYSWVSTGALARSNASHGEGDTAVGFSAYNAELVYTDAFGSLQYLLLRWEANDWSYGDPPSRHDLVTRYACRWCRRS